MIFPDLCYGVLCYGTHRFSDLLANTGGRRDGVHASSAGPRRTALRVPDVPVVRPPGFKNRRFRGSALP